MLPFLLLLLLLFHTTETFTELCCNYSRSNFTHPFNMCSIDSAVHTSVLNKLYFTVFNTYGLRSSSLEGLELRLYGDCWLDFSGNTTLYVYGLPVSCLSFVTLSWCVFGTRAPVHVFSAVKQWHLSQKPQETPKSRMLLSNPTICERLLGVSIG